MLRWGASQWRLARLAIQEGVSASKATQRSYSAGKPSPFNDEAVNSNLFDKAKATPLPSSEEAGQAAERLAAEPSTAGRIASQVGNTLFLGFLGASAYFGYYQYRYTTQEVENLIEETKKPENQFPGSDAWSGVMSWYVAQREKLDGQVKMYSNPTSDALLPDQDPRFRHVPTLVLDLDDVLVHSEWTRGRGWRTFKRPGVEDFLKRMAPYYEMVVYTSQLQTYAEPIMQRLDPVGYIPYRLYRTDTQYVDGKHVRDLSKLNRDLGKVLLITADPDAASLQKENAVIVKKWKLETEDTTLLDLIPFLEAVCSARQMDVRDVINSYEGQDIPTAFRERLKLAAEQQRQKKKGMFGFGGK